MENPQWAKNATLYEVNLRQYTPEGTFNAFAYHLPRLKDMGVRIIWLMPVNPIGHAHRKGTLGSYYSISDFRGVNTEHGTLQDLKNLIRKIHNLNMYVILDWVADHSSWDNPLVSEHPDWYQQDEKGNVISPVKEWTDVAGFNYNNAELREYMIQSLIYWIRETDIDGYRCDVAGMVPLSFWKQAVPRLLEVKEVLMLAEWETPEMHEAFHVTYSWDIYHLMNDIAKGIKGPKLIDTIWEENAKTFPADATRLRFITNHDENTWNGSECERMGAAVKAFAAFYFLIPGMPLMYNGQESGFNRRLPFFEKDAINWETYGLAPFYATLIYLRRRNKALMTLPEGGPLKKIATDRDEVVYAFSRSNGKDCVTAIFNFADHETSFTISDGAINCKYRNIFTNEKTGISPGMEFIFRPWEFRIFENL